MKTRVLKLKTLAILLVVAVVSICLFTACEEKEDDMKRWECVSDGFKITLDMYESVNKFYTTVNNTSQMTLLLGDDSWYHFQMNGDTMTILQIGDYTIPDYYDPPRWIISKPSYNVMIMDYFGTMPDDGSIKSEYLFNLK